MVDKDAPYHLRAECQEMDPVFAADSATVQTGLTIATNFQHYTGKPWAATTQVTLPQGSQRIQLEPRGTRRLSPQSLLDLRVSRTIVSGGLGRVELLLDVLNVLNIHGQVSGFRLFVQVEIRV